MAPFSLAHEANAALAALRQLRTSDTAKEKDDRDALAKRWGGIYYDLAHDSSGVGAALAALQKTALAEFSSTNALYPATFPSVLAMQAELVSYAVRLLLGKAEGSSACGILTSGGTESVLLAVLAHRERMRNKGIQSSRPRIVASASAHPALAKAAFYFGLDLVLVQPDPNTLRMGRAEAEKACTPDTALIYASAPTFAHGVVDDVVGLGALAAERGIGLHVDCCLGGVLLQHLLEEGLLTPGGAAEGAALPLAVRGVTSVSLDLHKYGYCAKGASVVAFSNPELRRAAMHPVVAVPGGQVSGGNYITASLQGSRGGGPIAAAWATVRCMRGEGYRAAARRLQAAFQALREGVRACPELELVGAGELGIVAFRSKSIPHTALAAAMQRRGWQLSSGENPSSMSVCIGEQHVAMADAFCRDLAAAVAEAAAAATQSERAPQQGHATAGPYQAAGADKTEAQVRELLFRFQEKLLDKAPGTPNSRL